MKIYVNLFGVDSFNWEFVPNYLSYIKSNMNMMEKKRTKKKRNEKAWAWAWA